MKAVVQLLANFVTIFISKKIKQEDPVVEIKGVVRFIDSVTVDKVKQMFPHTPVKNIEKHLRLVLEALERRGLGDKPLVLMALATIRAETESFLPISEYKSKYNTSPGGKPFDLYDGRYGNKTGEGKLFRGRGFVQLTFRANYEELDKKLKLDGNLVANPDYANIPEIASAILAEFLKSKEVKIREALDNGDLKAARRLVNGGSHSLDKFSSAYTKGESIL